MRTQRAPKKTTQRAPNPPLPPRVERVESPLLESDEAKLEFDIHKFRNAKGAEFYDKVIKHENIVEFNVFDYSSFDQDGLELFTNFMFGGVYKFCGFYCDYYLKLI